MRDSWALLFTFLVQSAVVAAVLNISIPLELGTLINSVASLQPGREAWHYLSELAPGTAKLLSLYVMQVSNRHTVLGYRGTYCDVQLPGKGYFVAMPPM